MISSNANASFNRRLMTDQWWFDPRSVYKSKPLEVVMWYWRSFKLYANINLMQTSQNSRLSVYMKISALLALCAGNSPVTGEIPSLRPVSRSFDVFFDLRLNKSLSKHSWGWWFETTSCLLWHHCNNLQSFIQYLVLMHSSFHLWYFLEFRTLLPLVYLQRRIPISKTACAVA